MPLISDSIGRVLGKRYRLVAALGTGASAHVFLAEDVSLRRRVAVKVLIPALAQDQAFLKRFGAEARSVAALNHPNILQVYDWGEDAGGPYLVLEYLSGGSLRDLLDRGTLLTYAQAARLGIQAAQGLAYAHARGLVHRDVKPANLLFDEEGRVRIADFGVARALAEAAWTEPAGAMIGTARYASPEQALGRPVDGRADVYGLALVLYESLTGEVPFTGDTTLATLMARIDKALPQHPLLGPLDDVLARAAAPDPEARLNAAGFALRLEAIAATLAPPAPLPLGPADEETSRAAQVLREELAGAGARDAAAGDLTRVQHAERRGGTEAGPRPSASTRSGAVVSQTVVAPPPTPRGAGATPGTEVARTAVAPGAGAGGPAHTVATHLATPTVAHAKAPYDQERRRGGRGVGGRTGGAPPPGGATTGARRAPEPPVIHRRPARPRWPWVVALVVVVAAAAVAGALALTKSPAPTARVPQLVGMSITTARRTAAAEHLRLSVGASVLSTTVARGLVATQSPGHGAKVAQQSTVHVALSSGLPTVTIPSLVKMTCTQADQALAAVHLRGDCPVDHGYSTTVAATHVLNWSYDTKLFATSAPWGSTIAIATSLGKPPRTVPSLAGVTTFTKAKAILAKTGFGATQATQSSTTVPKGKIIGTSPAEGTKATYGSTVTVEISTGPPMVKVPTVIGLTEATATAKLAATGLLAHFSGHGPTVTATTPPADTPVRKGTTVTCFLGPHV